MGESTSSWTNWKIFATSTQDIFAVEFGKQYQFRARATDALGNLGEWKQSDAQEIALPRVIINEIAWGGTKANANDEWLELYNAADYDFDAAAGHSPMAMTLKLFCNRNNYQKRAIFSFGAHQ